MARIENIDIDGTTYDIGKIATTSSLGVIQVGNGLNITPAGVLSSSAQNGLFIITVSNVDASQGTFTADKTYEEILTAFNSGKIPILKAPIPNDYGTDTVVATLYNVYADGEYDNISFVASSPDAQSTSGGLPSYIVNNVIFFDFEKDLTGNTPVYNNLYDNRSAGIGIVRTISPSSTDSQVPTAKSVYTALSTYIRADYLLPSNITSQEFTSSYLGSAVTANGVMSLAQSANSATFKVYGNLYMTRSTSTAGSVTLTAVPGLTGVYGVKTTLQLTNAPTEAFNIAAAGVNLRVNSDNSNTTGAYMLGVSIGTDGYIYLGGSTTNSISVAANSQLRWILHPCLYFNTNFG